MKKEYTEHSKFWLGEDFSLEKLDVETTYGLIKLAEYRRAIANFVYILSGKNIPVRFADKTTSMTDGEVIYIGGELAKGEFDPTVGIALHEAAHIVKSDFNLIKTLWGKLPSSLIELSKGKINSTELSNLAKYMLNIVEDRYIDAWVYKNAPGYRGYYNSLYDRYFNLPEVCQALKSADYRTSTIESYMFRVTNITNNCSDLDALPKLRKIYDLLDLSNILKEEMSTPKARLDLALVIVEEILSDVISGTDKEQEKQDDGDGEDSDSSDGSQDSDNSSSDENQSDASEQTDVKPDAKSENPKPEQEKDKKSPKPLPEKKKQRVNKLLKKQQDIVNRTNVKTSFDKKMINKLAVLEKSGVNIVTVGGEQSVPKTECIVVKNLTKELMDTDEFPYTLAEFAYTKGNDYSNAVTQGVTIGTMLGRRLQIRTETKVTKFTRLDRGKIDKRLISGLGYNAENLFYQATVDKYKNVHLHISVDASSSMTSKWENTMTMLVAIAKAASMVSNVSLSISFRSGVKMSARAGGEMPYVVIAYDSRKDSFNKITTLFPKLRPEGSTPEGLAFQAIMDHIPHSTRDMDSYFVNISDGEPAFWPSYRGEIAANHTRKQVKKMIENGIEILSYYVDNGYVMSQVNMRLFKMMYGNDAQFIDTKNVVQIAHTLNRKFLSKSMV